jgi:uncharacterized oligopeptide transporter (OPT) family protein
VTLKLVNFSTFTLKRIAQMITTVFRIIVCVPIYKLFDTAYQIGGTEMPAPAAHAWKDVH